MALSRYVTYATGTTGTQPSFQFDPSICPFQAAVAVYVVGGTASFGLQLSFDPIDVSDAASRWFNDQLIPAGTAASAYVTYASPVTKARVAIVTNTGGLELKVLQGFTKN